MVDSRPPGFRGFLRRLATTLDASDSLIESMVGLVVIIGVTSSSRIGFVDPALGVDAVLITALLVAIVWAVIDGGFVLVASLFRQGRVEIQGALIDIRTLSVQPLRIDPQVWAGFGWRHRAA